MNNKAVISGIVVVVLVAAGIWYATTRGPKENVENENPNTPTANGTTLAQLMEREGDAQCTFTQDISAGGASSRSVGTIYLSDKKIRGDFNTTVSGSDQAVETHMIQNDDSIYVWSSIAPQGFRVPAPKTQADIDANPEYYSAYNQPLNYECTPWNADVSFFTPPANITFVAADSAQ